MRKLARFTLASGQSRLFPALAARNKQVVVVLWEQKPHMHFPDDVLYHVRFADGYTSNVFHEELEFVNDGDGVVHAS